MRKDYFVLPINKEEITEESREIASKYKHVWKSVKLKIKFNLMILKLIKGSILSNRNENFRAIRVYPGLETLESEKRGATRCRWFVIMPNNKYLRYWNIIIFISLAYCAVIMPILIAFYYDDDILSIDVIDSVLGFIFAIDFFINCNTAIIRKSGQVTEDRLKILWNYARNWMIIDFLAFFPFDLISYNKNISPIFKLFRLTRLNKLLKISKLGKWIKFKNNYNVMIKLQDLFGINHAALQLIFTLTYITLSVHIVSCIWILSSRIESYAASTWVYRTDMIDRSSSDIYLSSFYWAVTTLSTVGYGEIAPYTLLEYFISIIWMFFGLYFLGFIIATLSSFINSIDTYNKILMNKLVQIDEFCNENELSENIKKKIKKTILKSAVSKIPYLQKQEILGELPKDLKYEIIKSMHKGAAMEIHFFAYSVIELSIEIVPYLNPMTVSSESFVYKKEEFASEIYFILNGIVGYIDPNKEAKFIKNKCKCTFYTILPKDYFGDIEVLLKIPRKYSAFSKRYCEMLYINYEIINKLKNSYLSIYLDIKTIAVQREKALSSIAKNLLEINKIAKSKSEKKIQKFKTKQILRRDMTNAMNYKRSDFSCAVNLNVIREKVSKIQDRLESLKKSLSWD